MSNTQKIALAVAGLVLVAGLYLVFERSGLIAWAALLLGAGMMAKAGFKPAKGDVGLSLGLAIVLIVAWIGTFYYVISTYESGEVVELELDTIKGQHIARVWVFEVGSDLVVYYDAPPDAAEALLAGTPFQFTRDGETSSRLPHAKEVDGLPEEEANEILTAMTTKYGDRMTAADISYLVLGRDRDRVAVIVKINEA